MIILIFGKNVLIVVLIMINGKKRYKYNSSILIYDKDK